MDERWHHYWISYTHTTPRGALPQFGALEFSTEGPITADIIQGDVERQIAYHHGHENVTVLAVSLLKVED
jgi:hypothetical protein